MAAPSTPSEEDLGIIRDLDTRFYLEALAEAVKVAGRVPDVLNTNQGCQYTSAAWTGAVEALGAKVSMDGKGRWVDNVFIERLWRSLKCEDIYLKDYRDLAGLEQGLTGWLEDYSHHRIHESLGYHVPWSIYRPQSKLAVAA